MVFGNERMGVVRVFFAILMDGTCHSTGVRRRHLCMHHGRYHGLGVGRPSGFLLPLMIPLTYRHRCNLRLDNSELFKFLWRGLKMRSSHYSDLSPA